MPTRFKRILELLAGAPTGARVALAAGALLLVAVVLLGGWQASQPDFVPLRAGLSEAQRAAAESALSEGGMAYEVSPYPGPYTIHVDRGELYRAQNLVALAGALAPEQVGIPTGATSMSSVWQTTVERLQSARKREWQECEKQLEALEFVEQATVTGSLGDASPFSEEEAPTISVSLVLARGVAPGDELGESVAKIVRYRFDTPPENVVIVDQRGRLLYDGSSLDAEAPRADHLLELEVRHDAQKAALANAGLARMFGEGLAHVTVDSEWSHDRVESVKESVDPESKVVLSEHTTSSKTPTGSAAGGVAGASSNTAYEAGVENAAIGGTGSGALAQESETQRMHAFGRETTHQVSVTPTLRRMSIALAVDQSLEARLPQLEEWVKAALHFDEERGDRFSSFATPFAGVARGEDGAPVPPEPAPAPPEPNPIVELLLRRGIELAAGLAFLVVLVKSLRGARRALGEAAAQAETARAAARPEVDADALARLQVEELVRSDPERVGEILSRWALEEPEPAGARR